MAQTDLQSLYKMRDILKREEYNAKYNKTINDNLVNTVNSELPEYLKYQTARNNYNKVVSDAKNGEIFSALAKFPNIITFIVVLVSGVLALLFSANPARTMTCVFATAAWSRLIDLGYSLAENDKVEKSIVSKAIKTHLLAFAAYTLLAIIANSVNGCSGFLAWTGAVLAFITWPIVNFFFLKPLKWLNIAVYILLAIFSISFHPEMTKEAKSKNMDGNNNVREAKMKLDNAKREYDAAYSAKYAIIKPSYTKLLKPDTTTAEKRALVSVIPAQFQNMDMVNKLIWCIEQKYAYDIVSARNWYLQQEQNAAMMKKLNAVVASVEESNRIQAQAAREAAEAQKAALEAMKKQNVDMNKQMDKLNKSVKEGAEAAKETAYYAEKIHREIKY